MRVLIVDDAPLMRERLSRIVKEAVEDCLVTVVGCLEGAMVALKSGAQYDLVISDHYLKDPPNPPEGQDVLAMASELSPAPYRILVSKKFIPGWTGYNASFVHQFISLHYSNETFASDLRTAVINRRPLVLESESSI